MEITHEFHQTLRFLKLNFSQDKEHLSNHKSLKPLNSSKNYENSREFNKRVRKLVQLTTRMKNFLLQNRKNYTNVYSTLISQASAMTDIDRDKIDKDVYDFMNNCHLQIECLKVEVRNKRKFLTNQQIDHYNAIIGLVEQYLKSVCDLYSQQKSIRVKRAKEKQKLSRLEIDLKTDNNLQEKEDEKIFFKPDNYLSNSVSFVFNSKNKETSQNNKNKNSQEYAEYHDVKLDEENKHNLEDFTLEELQVFEEENKKLFTEFNSLSDETKQLEGRVVEIARLQELFTENILKQEQDLNRLNETAVISTENIRTGNEQIRGAMKKKASLRIWILFFNITLAFAILFLEWYNP